MILVCRFEEFCAAVCGPPGNVAKIAAWGEKDLLVLFSAVFDGGNDGRGGVELDAFLRFFDDSLR